MIVKMRKSKRRKRREIQGKGWGPSQNRLRQPVRKKMVGQESLNWVIGKQYTGIEIKSKRVGTG